MSYELSSRGGNLDRTLKSYSANEITTGMAVTSFEMSLRLATATILHVNLHHVFYVTITRRMILSHIVKIFLQIFPYCGSYNIITILSKSAAEIAQER